MAVTTSTNIPAPNVDAFLSTFLSAPVGNTPAAIRQRLIHWIAVANNPEAYTGGDASPYAINERKRTAVQNLKKLAQRHKPIADQLMSEREHLATVAAAHNVEAR
jgi:hypothetical protein